MVCRGNVTGVTSLSCTGIVMIVQLFVLVTSDIFTSGDHKTH